MLSVEQVRQELERYEHPLFAFDAQENAQGTPTLVIRLRQPLEGVEEYRLALHERDVGGSQFAWSLQRLLYDCMHDFIAEMFIRTPQSRTPGTLQMDQP